ncbi:hypothetical protein AWJ20_455 [Sugiyamaella lignohabitans]|uniref:CAAX prenyl protease 2/Lysostaphin resistance protein A-like domain-containing protein n=1 Tax=Sugiyamaella lignohabitans TaxID=796027 RepID=A0A167CX21_9ASCO|nr:uncharacterized protein AWJ20_455 [Sugiyamaella lignohabitans]ANB12210.1 hypothetical protein AWJ20_455 [Sugiyamaella lignohabitans]
MARFSLTGYSNDFRSLSPTVGLFILTTFIFSSVPWVLTAISNKYGSLGFSLYSEMLMWCPGLAAFLTLLYNKRPIASLRWNWPTNYYVLLSWLLPIAYTLLSYIGVWTIGKGKFPNRLTMDEFAIRLGLGLSPLASTIIYVLLEGTFGMFPAISSALGEEIGWRGFLLPELVKSYSFTASSIFVGLVWSVWHYPLILTSDFYSSTAPVWYQLICFTVYVTSLSVIFGWIRLKSGSLWTGAILHASQNLYMQVFLTPLTANTGHTAWYIDEFGVALPITSLITAIYFWGRRHELELGVRLPLQEV